MISVIPRGSTFRFFYGMTYGDELEQLELGILDLERRIFETSSGIAHEVL